MRSIVGRFLEHSRIYRFGADPAEAEYLIGSADLMPRNLDRRVEALTPVTDPRLRARLAELLDANLADDTLAWELSADGTWHKLPTVAGKSTQRRLQELAIARSHVVLMLEHETQVLARTVLPGPRPGHPPPGRARRRARHAPPPGHLLRHRRLPPRARRREPAVPQRRRLDGEAARSRRTAGALDTPGAAHRRRTRRRPARRGGRSRARARPPRAAATGRAAQHRADARRAARRAGREDRRSRRRRGLACSTASASRRASASSRWRSRRTRRDSLEAALVARLRAAGAGHPDPVPKIVRALGPRAADPPDVAAAAATRLRVHAGRGRAGGDRRPRPAGCSSTTRACASAPIPSPCTRRGSPPVACAPTCAPSGACSTRSGASRFASS